MISGTRVIYPADQKDVSVWFQSKNKRPALVQVWLDDGNENVAPEKAKVPFIATPPVFRLEPEKQQVVRLVYTGEALPTNKESLFWLNMLEVPPKVKDEEAANQLQLAFRTRLKVFFRPKDLPYEPTLAPEKLTWDVVEDKQGFALKVSNPSPYYVSFDSVSLNVAGKRYEKPVGQTSADNMVGPGADSTFALPSLKSMPGADAQVEFESIDDIGAKVSHTSKVSH
ncbi:fimbria/pilus periplasmic chaperone [Pseudomonas sp. O64]|uniref:fimbria/pilus periplasmic chaperone n=1 Tax=unclassified Pseudomonas TaxID=196821 RepID=UPI0021DB26D1|nr:fimbria/pilus periplasmic chaperone [Pseudomonas sp. YeP6b]